MGRPSIYTYLSPAKKGERERYAASWNNNGESIDHPRDEKNFSLSLSLSLVVRRWWSNVGWNREGDSTAISYILHTNGYNRNGNGRREPLRLIRVTNSTRRPENCWKQSTKYTTIETVHRSRDPRDFVLVSPRVSFTSGCPERDTGEC